MCRGIPEIVPSEPHGVAESVRALAPDRLDVVPALAQVEDDDAEPRGPEALDGLHAADAGVGLEPVEHGLSLGHSHSLDVVDAESDTEVIWRLAVGCTPAALAVLLEELVKLVVEVHAEV